MGKGVLKAVSNINDIIAPMVMGMDPTKQVRFGLSISENEISHHHLLNEVGYPRIGTS